MPRALSWDWVVWTGRAGAGFWAGKTVPESKSRAVTNDDFMRGKSTTIVVWAATAG